MKTKPPTQKQRLECLERELHELRKTMATAAELQSAVDALTAAVARVQAEVTELKSRPPVAQNVEQAQLDANTDAVTAATATLNGL